MPFSWTKSPALGISLLKASLRRIGIEAEIRYLNLDFADRIGHMLQNSLAATPTGFVGDWIFSAALHGIPSREEDDAYWYDRALVTSKVPDYDVPGLRRKVRELQREACEFVDDFMEAEDLHHYRIIGFTCTFQQDIAALSLGRRIKERCPDTLVVFGGAHYEGEMGAARLRCFPFIDAVFSGEADRTFPQFVDSVLHDKPLDALRGFMIRQPDTGEVVGSADPVPTTNLDLLPYPDYEDYFVQLDASEGRFDVVLPFESARGCWWGEKHHCTFCGLNGAGMAFRRKSPERLLDEVRWFLNEHGHQFRGLVDVSNILDMRYLKDFVPALMELPVSDGFYIFSETKSNLSKEHVRLLAQGRITRIQPGIESLSTPILELMKKGCTVLQNIQLLKWCALYHVEAQWNLLYGFPGEDPNEYFRQAELMPLLHHLQPPSWIGPVRVDRFSPYFENPGSFGISSLRPQAPYRHLYRVTEEELENIAYYFDHDRSYLQGVKYLDAVEAEVHRWQQVFGRVRLAGHASDQGLIVNDTRSIATQEWTILDPAHARILESLDTSLPRSRLDRLMADEFGLERPAIDELVNGLLSCGFLVRDGARLLSLVLPTLDPHEAEHSVVKPADLKSSEELVT